MAGDCLTYAQGQIATLPAQFLTSPEGSPVDVPDATVEIFGAGMSVVIPPTTMTHFMTGFYFFEWAIPNSQPVGTYTVRYTGTVLGVPTAAIDTLTLLAAGSTTPATTSQTAAGAVAALEKYLSCAQNIPVYNELARRIGTDRTIYQLTWPRWNLGNHIIKLNSEITDLGYTLNLDTGTIVFDAPLHKTDVVKGSYNFRFFSQTDLLRFLTDALSQINLEAGGSGATFTLDNVPDSYIGVLLMGASKNAIKKLLLCLNFQEPATIFGGREGAQQAITNLNSLKENYEKEFTTDKKQLKRARYPGTVGVVQPEYTLPGGRCLSPYAVSTYVFNETEKETTIEQAFVIFESGESVSVKSHDLKGNIVFAPVSKIWKTEPKKSWVLTTQNGRKIKTSSEHLFFANGKYIPMMDLSNGDALVCVIGNEIVQDSVSSISETDEVVQMYDIEVPSTGNLFANGIQCHNSRWFRYLFSGGAG